MQKLPFEFILFCEEYYFINSQIRQGLTPGADCKLAIICQNQTGIGPVLAASHRLYLSVSDISMT